MLGPSLTIEEARRRAAVMLASVAVERSEDVAASQPVANKRVRSGQPEPQPSQVVTLRELAERFVRVHADARLKPGTAYNYRHYLASVILPALGDRDFRSVKRSEINELHAKMKDTPGAANSMLAAASSLFTWIFRELELEDLRNPAIGIEHFATKKRERFLTPEERQRVQAVIEAGLKIPASRKGHLHIASVWALDLLALTGRRRNEIVLLKWEMIDWQHSIMDLPDTKGGQLKVAVSAHVLGLLKHIHDQTGNPRSGYVLRGPRGTRLKSINRTWENIRDAAEIPDVRLHDLRHSFASDALMCGVPLAVVGEMLGHKHARTTQRYAHLANHVVRQGLEVATARIVEATRPVAILVPPPFERVSDQQWKGIAAMVEATRGTGGGPRTDLRRIVDAVRWVLHTGAKWRALPAELGKASTCWRWYERWCGDGTWPKIAAALELPSIELGREPRHHTPRSATSPKPTIEVTAMEVATSHVRRSPRVTALREFG